MKKAISLCAGVLLLMVALCSCENHDNDPKSYKIYWDITNYNYEASQEITDLLATFDEYIGQGSYGDSISNHTIIAKGITYSEYKALREETVALADRADSLLHATWKPTKKYRVRVYCYCYDDYDYYSTTGSSTEVWATYTFKKE